jgi:pimeloyl-ACP methyl ester carboxylesterase
MRYRGPMLIVHGSSDTMVPVQAMREHHRIVAQSELTVVEGNHFIVFERPGAIAQPLESFLQRVQNKP